jgi:hypothetical protein
MVKLFGFIFAENAGLVLRKLSFIACSRVLLKLLSGFTGPLYFLDLIESPLRLIVARGLFRVSNLAPGVDTGRF